MKKPKCIKFVVWCVHLWKGREIVGPQIKQSIETPRPPQGQGFHA